MCMCGRYTLRTHWQKIADYFGILVTDVPELFAARYNGAPTQQVLAVRQDAEGQRQAAILKWGFIPYWSKDGKIAPINAMSEAASEKPMFRTAIRKRRCPLPAARWRRRHLADALAAFNAGRRAGETPGPRPLCRWLS